MIASGDHAGEAGVQVVLLQLRLAPPATTLANSPTASMTSALISSISHINMADAAFKATSRDRLSTTVPRALPERPMTPLISWFGSGVGLQFELSPPHLATEHGRKCVVERADERIDVFHAHGWFS